MASSVINRSVDGSDMEIYLAIPDTPGPHPGLVVAQHISGADAYIRWMCDRFAAEGFVAAAPNIYHRNLSGNLFEELVGLEVGDPRANEILSPVTGLINDEEIVRDCNETIATIRAAGGVGAGPVGIVGFCQGGRTSYLMATRSSTLKAAAIFFPGNLFIPRGDGPSPFAASDRISCPVAGFFGNDDFNPTRDEVDRIESEFKRLGIDYEFHRYDDAGHSFTVWSIPKFYRPEVAAEAWPVCVEFLNRRVKAAAVA